jgi:hypothetical protein
MGLVIRMLLYALSMFLSGYGFASFDESSMTLTINLEQLAIVLGGLATFVGTFIAGRWAKAKGGVT